MKPKIKRNIFISAIVVTIIGGLNFCCFSQDFNYQEAYHLYHKVLRGERSLESLTDVERRHLIIIHKALSHASNGERDEECREAKERARSAADELAYYANKLRSCAEDYDFSDDCYSQFRRTNNAFDDYESAVSEISNECD